jgi:transposase
VTSRAAYAAGRSHSAIGDFFRRKRAQLGAPEAIISTAHKLARVAHHMICCTPTPYDETRFADQQHRSRDI